MEKKINVAELLKDCPKGMELDCTMYDNAQLDYVLEGNAYPIKVQTPDGQISLNKYGCYSNNKHAKCIIFPKGKTSWEGFVPPCRFKDGGIIYVKAAYEWVAIYKESNGDDLHKYVGIRVWGDVFVNDCNPLCYKGDIREIRYATEEEKQKLFKAIEDNGYRWNAETKTLEKLIEPKFKVGDKIKKKKYYISGIITDINDGAYIVEYKSGGVSYANIEFQEDWELVPDKFEITTLNPFDKVLVRQNDSGKWSIDFFGGYAEGFYYTTGSSMYIQCIPYKGNEELRGTTNNCDDFYKTWE